MCSLLSLMQLVLPESASISPPMYSTHVENKGGFGCKRTAQMRHLIRDVAVSLTGLLRLQKLSDNLPSIISAEACTRAGGP